MGDFDLTGRVAVITGGNSGIGLGMADALARAGCAISIPGRNPESNAARPRGCVLTAARSNETVRRSDRRPSSSSRNPRRV